MPAISAAAMSFELFWATVARQQASPIVAADVS
jgi:hypothetical protein